jgi:uncharacterized protein YqjF (DUF2071 family)
MRMNWVELLFLHWPAPFDELRSRIPPGLQVDTFEGQAWLSIVPFRMTGVAPRLVPDVPFFSAFPELNVRTYVTDGRRSGVWFFSLDATSRLAVRAARWLFHLPYMDARINFTRPSENPDWIQYTSQRVHHNEPAAELEVEYCPKGQPRTTVSGSLEHWLTARYLMYMSDAAGRIFDGEVDHDPWQLRDVEVVVRRNTMTKGLNLDTGLNPPLAHYADLTKVVAWRKRPVVTLS